MRHCRFGLDHKKDWKKKTPKPPNPNARGGASARGQVGARALPAGSGPAVKLMRGPKRCHTRDPSLATEMGTHCRTCERPRSRPAGAGGILTGAELLQTRAGDFPSTAARAPGPSSCWTKAPSVEARLRGRQGSPRPALLPRRGLLCPPAHKLRGCSQVQGLVLTPSRPPCLWGPRLCRLHPGLASGRAAQRTRRGRVERGSVSAPHLSGPCPRGSPLGSSPHLVMRRRRVPPATTPCG